VEAENLPEISDYLTFINEGVDRIQLLINDLLEYARVGRANVPLKTVDMDKVLSNTLENLKIIINENNVAINASHLPEVKGFSPLLGSLFQNLLENAIKFRGDRKPEIEIGAKEEEDMYVFYIKDNGIGVEEQYADRIFIIFQRLHGRDKYPGTGVGLAICKKIVELHGGKIWVESKKDMGCTFFFTLPKAI
jgi:light-regulated signal transduction histidine kinase (bacteriophytochrome)